MKKYRIVKCWTECTDPVTKETTVYDVYYELQYRNLWTTLFVFGGWDYLFDPSLEDTYDTLGKAKEDLLKYIRKTKTKTVEMEETVFTY